jgi:hypothetical protein
MYDVVPLTENQVLPADSDGFVVARNASGRRVMWCRTQVYVPTSAPQSSICEGEWNVAIERAATLARATSSPLFVIRG